MKIRRMIALVLAFMITIGSPELLMAQENEVTTGQEIVLQNIEDIQTSKLTSDVTVLDFSLEDGEFLGSVGDINMYASPNSITQTIPGVISTENGIAYLNVGLSTNDILQVTLECPNNINLDYDLYLYGYDDTGTLDMENVIVSSTLTTYQNNENGVLKTMDESLSFVNTASEYKTYAIVVYAASGYSGVDEFSLTISIDENGYYDTMEPNDSPYTATDLGMSSEVSISL